MKIKNFFAVLLLMLVAFSTNVMMAQATGMTIPIDEAVMQYVSDALNGKITAEQYGEPRGSLTIILPEATGEEAVEPAA